MRSRSGAAVPIFRRLGGHGSRQVGRSVRALAPPYLSSDGWVAMAATGSEDPSALPCRRDQSVAPPRRRTDLPTLGSPWQPPGRRIRPGSGAAAQFVALPRRCTDLPTLGSPWQPPGRKIRPRSRAAAPIFRRLGRHGSHQVGTWARRHPCSSTPARVAGPQRATGTGCGFAQAYVALTDRSPPRRIIVTAFRRTHGPPQRPSRGRADSTTARAVRALTRLGSLLSTCRSRPAWRTPHSRARPTLRNLSQRRTPPASP